MTQLHQRPSHQGPVPVDQHLAGVLRRVRWPAHMGPAAPDAHERVLGELLGLDTIARKQEAEPAQPPVLAGEELSKLEIVDGHGRSWCGVANSLNTG